MKPAVGEEEAIQEMRASLVAFREAATRVARRVSDSQRTLRAVLTPPGGVPCAPLDPAPLADPPAER
jgi:hypothetical protein